MPWGLEGIKHCLEHPNKIASHKILYKGSITYVCIYCSGAQWPEGAQIVELKRKKYPK